MADSSPNPLLKIKTNRPMANRAKQKSLNEKRPLRRNGVFRNENNVLFDKGEMFIFGELFETDFWFVYTRHP